MPSSKIDVSKIYPNFWGKLVYYLAPFRRRTVLENLEIAFGASHSKEDLKKIAQSFYGHAVRFFFENLGLGWTDPRRLQGVVRTQDVDIVHREAKKNKGILLLTGHFGNWEMAPIGIMLHFQEFKGRFFIVRRRLVNKTFERILFGRFNQAGLNVIPKKNSLDQVLDALERNDVVVFVMDQYAKPGKDGVLVDFFGRKAGTFRSLAVVARSTGAPVVPMKCYWEKSGHHVMKFYEPVRWIEDPDPDAEILANTRQYNRVLEQMVLEHPDQWLWFHRRWKVKV